MKAFVVRCWSLVAALLIFECATTKPAEAPPPPLTEIPSSVLESFCARLRDEGYSAEQAIEAVRTTQPLATAQSMKGLAEAAGYAKSFDPVAAAQTASLDPLPVVVPRANCAWRAVEESARRSGDIMTVELSTPFANPFVRHSFGLFARVSLAREAATWYWVPLAARDGRWAAGTPILLSVR